MSRNIGPNLWPFIRAVPRFRDWPGPLVGFLIAATVVAVAAVVFNALNSWARNADAERARENHPVNVAKCEARGGTVERYADEQAECLRNGEILDEWWAP